MVLACGVAMRTHYTDCCRSRDDFVHHISVNIGQTKITARVTICEPRVIETHQMKNGRVQIVNGGDILDCLEAELIGCSIAAGCLDARPRDIRVSQIDTDETGRPVVPVTGRFDLEVLIG